MSKLRIFLADDHAVVREGLKRLIDAEPDMEVVGEAADGRAAVEGASKLNPDVVVLDLSMPEFNGAQAAQRLKPACPGAKVLALTVHEDKSYLRELIEAGAAGYVLKRAAGDELIRAIRSVATGETYFDPRLSGLLAAGLVRTLIKPELPADLSDRETEVLRLIAQGYSNKEVAARLALSVKTVETYKTRSMEKLRLRSRVDIVRHAAEQGWLSRPADG